MLVTSQGQGKLRWRRGRTWVRRQRSTTEIGSGMAADAAHVAGISA